MDRHALLQQLEVALAAIADWQAQWEPFRTDPTLEISPERTAAVLDQLTSRLRENYPYHHPRYAGQMLKPPHPVAMLAYFAAMQINPNNHALDGGIATSHLERAVVPLLAQMFGFPATHLGHLTSSGTIANLEALWVARESRPGTAIVAGEQAHYTHARMCALLGVPFVVAPCDADGRMDVDALRSLLARENIGTVVGTAGTTGLGMVDPLHEIIPLAREAGARVHVDAAYGGFFTLLAHQASPPVDPEPFLAIAEADSVVVDPHKHGLQPYGCGAVLFRDPAVGRFYAHNSPYTYFTSAELHLGEISLECSRAGAAAAAFWATLQAFPLEPERGFGPILARCRAAAVEWAARLQAHPRFRLVTQPDLDIVNFYAVPDGDAPPTASAISALSERIFRGAEHDLQEPVYLAKLKASPQQLAARDPSIIWDTPDVTVVRSVLMKPEHADWVDRLQRAIERHI
ncbi:MAG: aspartate aminotransferase family protein [Chloroflexi bacterium]|nr:MAG: aspartate aminotransferase family protein [Chloroflexota bacterium]